MNLRWGPGTRIGYLSAAPRVSTYDDAEASGPRSHVLGVIRAFEELGMTVRPFIVGDRMPRRVRVRSERLLHNGGVQAFAADVARIAMGAANARRAWTELGRDVDWVYERAASLQSLGWIFKRRGIPWIVETSSPVFYEAKTERKAVVLARLARRRELAMYRACDAVVVVSEALQTILADEGVDPRKMILIPNGVDLAVFDPAPHRDVPRMFPGFTIGFAGAVIGWQGLVELIDAVAKLRARNIDISVAIAGDGVGLPDCERRARELGITDAVRLLGRLAGSQIPAFLAGVDIAYSGQKELKLGRMYHSPLKLYEYMAMARPVVASEFEDAKRLIADGETGFLFRAGDAAGLEHALLAAYEARPRIPAMGEAARRVIVEHHSWLARVEAMRGALARIV